tara:strand:- start:537 stop:848 length:312 start_codon:yes stop_codon:yes gene_type:complete
MTTCEITTNTITNTITDTITDNERLNMLLKENTQLKNINNKLHRKTLNLKRKNLRLKKVLNTNESVEPAHNTYDDQLITDVGWEDVCDLIQSYDIEDQINNER